jgi:hypothetical protein
VVDLDAAFGEQLFDVAVGEAKAQVPADRQLDHIRREAETGEGRPWDGIGADAASSHMPQSGCSDPRGVPEADRCRHQQLPRDEGLRCAVACSRSLAEVSCGLVVRLPSGASQP